MTFDEIVTDYIREYRDDTRTEMRFVEFSAVRPRAAGRERGNCPPPPAQSGTVTGRPMSLPEVTA